MKKLLLGGIVIAAAVALAACGGGGGGSATASSGTGGNTVSTMSVSGTGTVLVDSSGQALYASVQESAAGKVLCTGACNSFWQPLAASGKVTSSGSIGGKLATVKRPDGSTQVTYNGAPLYTFTQDSPGNVKGNGLSDDFNGQHLTWHTVTADGTAAGMTPTTNGGVPAYGGY